MWLGGTPKTTDAEEPPEPYWVQRQGVRLMVFQPTDQMIVDESDGQWDERED